MPGSVGVATPLTGGRPWSGAAGEAPGNTGQEADAQHGTDQPTSSPKADPAAPIVDVPPANQAMASRPREHGSERSPADQATASHAMSKRCGFSREPGGRAFWAATWSDGVRQHSAAPSIATGARRGAPRPGAQPRPLRQHGHTRAPVTAITPTRNGAPPPGATDRADHASDDQDEVLPAQCRGRAFAVPSGPEQTDDRHQPEREEDQALAGGLVEVMVGLIAGEQHPADVHGEHRRQGAREDAGGDQRRTASGAGRTPDVVEIGLGGARESCHGSTLDRPVSRVHRRRVLSVSRSRARTARRGHTDTDCNLRPPTRVLEAMEWRGDRCTDLQGRG